MIRTLIVEDAPVVRKGIRLLLEQEDDIEIVGEAEDGPAAVAKIVELRPDLLILDIQMPGFDGFEVLKRTQGTHVCALIFITAHADYAMRAFDADALSYLLKPINGPRLREVIQRARLLLGDERLLTSNQAAIERVISASGGPTRVESGSTTIQRTPISRLVVKVADRFVFVKANEIDWIGSTGEYATVYTSRASHLVRIPLSELEEMLDPAQFARTHRSTIVNLDRVQEIRSRSHGDCDVILHNGRVLRLSRSYRESLLVHRQRAPR